MRLSNYFIPILKHTKSDVKIKSHDLMLRSGMVMQNAAGIYTWLPLGLRVIEKLKNIIRKHMAEIGAIEMSTPCLQDSSLWHQSGRYGNYGQELLCISDRHDNELVFAPTAEECFTEIASHYMHSYKDLPKILYQIQWKFRDEIRPRFGMIRSREFLMKDAYSFDLNEVTALQTYKKIFTAYMKIFHEIGIRAIPFKGSSGEIGGSLNHEFHILSQIGETGLYYDKRILELTSEDSFHIDTYNNLYSATDEVHNSDDFVSNDILYSKGIEVGQIFNFGEKYSDPMKARVNDETGKMVNINMGSYGIGISRLVAAIIEANHDENGIIWPSKVTPYQVSLVNLQPKNDSCIALSNKLYDMIISANIDVLYDDSLNSPGSKFATHDLLGFAIQIFIGRETLQNEQYEVKIRSTQEKFFVDINNIINTIKLHS